MVRLVFQSKKPIIYYYLGFLGGHWALIKKILQLDTL